MNILEISQLTCGYGDKAVLFDIDLKVSSDEVLGIVGPNGSGKSTLLRAFSYAIDPFEGQINMDGRPLKYMPRKALARQLAVVSQEHVFSHMTVADLVFLGRTPYLGRLQFYGGNKDQEAVDKALALTGTSDLADRLLGELSGGERQLVFIARALAQEPRLLILDEPTNHLDIKHQVQVMDLIHRLNREQGLTVIMVLHDLNLAGAYCDRIVLMNRGRIYKKGCPADVLTADLIEEVYQTKVQVKMDRELQRPCVFLLPENEVRRR